MKTIALAQKTTLQYRSFSRSYWHCLTPIRNRFITSLSWQFGSKTATSIGSLPAHSRTCEKTGGSVVNCRSCHQKLLCASISTDAIVIGNEEQMNYASWCGYSPIKRLQVRLACRANCCSMQVFHRLDSCLWRATFELGKVVPGRRPDTIWIAFSIEMESTTELRSRTASATSRKRSSS